MAPEIEEGGPLLCVFFFSQTQFVQDKQQIRSNKNYFTSSDPHHSISTHIFWHFT